MNYINCKDVNLPSDMRKAVEFWARNTVGHIETLLNLKGTTSAVMQPYFSAELETLLRSFKKISSLYGEEETRRLPSKPQLLFAENRRLINLLERM